MAKISSSLSHRLGRFVKALVGLLLIPPVMGMGLGLHEGLAARSVWGRSAAWWFDWGVVGYSICHVLLYKPKALFAISHRLLARLARWLFGGQVSTVGQEGPKAAKTSGKSKGNAPAPEGSTLVALSPYVVPLYVVLISLAAWGVAQWRPSEFLSGMALISIGVALALHIEMAADDLQQDGGKFPIETYLMALAIIGLAGLFLTSVCVPLILPDFSALDVMAQATVHARTIYTNVIQTLFF